MSIELYVEGLANAKQGKGQRYEMADYTVQEDSTPLNAGDSFGGTGQLSFDVIEEGSGIEYLYDREVEITDGYNGRFSGHVKSIAAQNGVASVVVDSLQAQLNGDISVPPYVGTLAGAIQLYCAYAGIPADRIVIDGSIGPRAVAYPGWRGSIWTQLKQLLAVEQVELSEVSSRIVVRPPRQREVNRTTDASISWSVGEQKMARYVEVYNYNSKSLTGQQVYPTGDGTVVSIQSGETTIIQANVEASLTSVRQPIAVETVKGVSLSESVYTVIDKDGVSVNPTAWTLAGGDVKVDIGADFSSLIITITGAELPNGPFRLATSDLTGENISSLRISGSGVFYQKELIRIRTGAPQNKAVTDVGASIDSPFISNAAKAYTVAYALAATFAGPSLEIATEVAIANRPDEEGSATALTFGEFNTLYSGYTFTMFNGFWGTKTFEEISDYIFSLKDQDFQNQAFGNVAGSLLMERNARFRVRSATITPDRIRIQADNDTTFADFNAAMGSKTFSAFNSLWQNSLYSDLAIQPLRVE